MAMDDREGLVFKNRIAARRSRPRRARVMTYYELLRVEPCATDDEIKAAYRRRSLEGPDRRGERRGTLPGGGARAHGAVRPRKRAASLGREGGPGLKSSTTPLVRRRGGGAAGLRGLGLRGCRGAREAHAPVVGAVLVLAAFWRRGGQAVMGCATTRSGGSRRADGRVRRRVRFGRGSHERHHLGDGARGTAATALFPPGPSWGGGAVGGTPALGLATARARAVGDSATFSGSRRASGRRRRCADEAVVPQSPARLDASARPRRP